ncbi:MAG: dihydroorotate dehydrogenase [Smithellaceae bacterium]|nr:dihydroorotate dehydrogenase [Smithellaceae bacterium]
MVTKGSGVFSIVNDNLNMAVCIGRGLIIKNPVMTASGTFGYGMEYDGLVDLSRLGAVVVKGLSLKPRAGNPPPRITETPAGMLNAIGLQNIGIEAFLAEKLPLLKERNAVIIANIYGETPEEFRQVARKLTGAGGIAALEINISCPNVLKGGAAFGSDPKLASEVTIAARDATDLPLIVKLSPNVTDIAEIARSVEQAGADAISLINTLKGMSIDVERRMPKLRNIIGGLSGPAIRPVALRMVWEVVQKVSIPVIGMGGIAEAADALEFLIAGARAVEVGTANFVNPQATLRIIEGIEDYLRRHKIDDINDLIGSLAV